MKKLIIMIWLSSLATLFGVSQPAFGFAEDLCTDTSKITGKPFVKDCISANCTATANDFSICNIAITLQSFLSTSDGTARGMIHFDSVYLLAQAAGFREDLAYWIAAYDQVVDVGDRFMPFDRCGKVITDGKYQPIKMNGFSRDIVNAGSIGVHYGTFFLPSISSHTPAGASGIDPQITEDMKGGHFDRVFEGMLNASRNWAFNGTQPCTNGFTNPDSPLPENPTADDFAAYFEGAQCFQPDETMSSHLIQGHAPLFYASALKIGGTVAPDFAANQGYQVASFKKTPTGNSLTDNAFDTCPSSDPDYSLLYFDSDKKDKCNQSEFVGENKPKSVQTLLDEGSGILWSKQNANQQWDQVPIGLVRFGVYLHILADRISHFECGDVSYAQGLVKLTDADQQQKDGFWFQYDDDACDQMWHAVNHSREIGQPELAMQTTTALVHTYRELKRFRAKLQKDGASSEWFVNHPTLTEAKLLGVMKVQTTGKDAGAAYFTESTDSLLKALKVSSATGRLAAFNKLYETFGLKKLPYDENITSCN